MKIIVPMAGRGERFRRAGYSTIKPLILIEGKPLIEHVVEMFPGEDEFLFICAKDHLDSHPLATVLKRLAPRCNIEAIEPHKKGPVWTVLQAQHLIPDASPCVVNYCDFTVDWDYENFRKCALSGRWDGVIAVYKGFHPHHLGPNKYGYLRMTEQGVVEVREKESFTSDRFSEPASSGTYFFRSGKTLKNYFSLALSENLNTGGEFFASLPYNLMIRAGLSVGAYEIDHFVQLGTPEDLEEYAAWSEWFRSGAVFRPDCQLPGSALVPAAGRGVRFRTAGYTLPKPLIEVGGIPMISRSVECLPSTERLLLIGHQELAPYRDRLMQGCCSTHPDSQILLTDSRTSGQATTCLLAEPHFPPNDPVLVASCDATVSYDVSELLTQIRNPAVEFLVWCFRNHPHAVRHPEQYGWINLGQNDSVENVICKRPPKGGVRDAPGICGLFWFRTARRFFDEIQKMIAANERINGEFYIDMVAARMARAGVLGKVIPVRSYISYGTPSDVHTFEYWESYFAKKTLREAQRPAGKVAK